MGPAGTSSMADHLTPSKRAHFTTVGALPLRASSQRQATPGPNGTRHGSSYVYGKPTPNFSGQIVPGTTPLVPSRLDFQVSPASSEYWTFDWSVPSRPTSPKPHHQRPSD